MISFGTVAIKELPAFLNVVILSIGLYMIVSYNTCLVFTMEDQHIFLFRARLAVLCLNSSHG
jgi:hypothetical protein